MTAEYPAPSPISPVAPAEPLWQRLDRRMILVNAVVEAVKLVPVLIVTTFVSSGGGSWILPLGAAGAAIVFGLLFGWIRWITTTYRVGPADIELRTGVLQRRNLAVPRTRIRSVDVEANLLHRMLGLAVVVVGTGQQAAKSEDFKLDALDRTVVPALRAELLAHTSAPEPLATDTGPTDTGTAGPRAGHTTARQSREIGHWQPQWARYAPLSLTGFAVLASIIGFAVNYGAYDSISVDVSADDIDRNWILIAAGLTGVALLATAVLGSALACGHYLVTYFGLQVLDDGRTLQVKHGLLTRHQITVDLARFRGATLAEPLLLRWASAAELEMIMTGENPRQKILPQAPRSAVRRTLDELLQSLHQRQAAPTTPDDSRPGPVSISKPVAAATDTDSAAAITGDTLGTAELVPHGPMARRRRYFRALAPLVVLAVVAVLVGVPAWPWLLFAVAALLLAALAEDRYRGLGHRVLTNPQGPTWLITRQGSLNRNRDCLEAPGIIGWTVRRTYFQRRAGLATLIAATAAGRKAYTVSDVPVDQAWAIIEAVTPGRTGAR